VVGGGPTSAGGAVTCSGTTGGAFDGLISFFSGASITLFFDNSPTATSA
jgi:hypothetical protein